MRKPLTINFNDEYEVDNWALRRVRDIASKERLSASAVLMRLVIAGLNIDDTEKPPDAISELTGIVAAMQARLTSIESRLTSGVVAMRDSGEITPDTARRLVDHVGETFTELSPIEVNIGKTAFKPGLRLEE